MAISVRGKALKLYTYNKGFSDDVPYSGTVPGWTTDGTVINFIVPKANVPYSTLSSNLVGKKLSDVNGLPISAQFEYLDANFPYWFFSPSLYGLWGSTSIPLKEFARYFTYMYDGSLLLNSNGVVAILDDDLTGFALSAYISTGASPRQLNSLYIKNGFNVVGGPGTYRLHNYSTADDFLYNTSIGGSIRIIGIDSNNTYFEITATSSYRGNRNGYWIQTVTNISNPDILAFLRTTEDDYKPVVPPTDPYETGGGPSTTGGGTGTFSETGDIVGIPGLPTLSAVDTGFITLFNPTAAQVKQLASYMWSDSFDMATFKNIVANPIDCILGLTIVPVDPPNAGSKSVSVGNIPTGVNMPYLSSQYVEVDCGTLNVQEFWGSYLDYSPYTKMSLYLPYIGIVPLDIDDVMNATITIKYHVDVLSGACVAYVLCNGTQLYTYIGQCSSNVPVTSNDFTNTVNGILGIAGSIGSLVATGGASAPTEIGNMAGNAINALKPNIQKSGAMSGTGGLMGVQTPYLICQRPRQSVPASQNTFTGYPANITATLSDLSGYTEVDKIHLEGVPCTNEEMNEIMTLLESGVYI